MFVDVIKEPATERVKTLEDAELLNIAKSNIDIYLNTKNERTQYGIIKLVESRLQNNLIKLKHTKKYLTTSGNSLKGVLSKISKTAKEMNQLIHSE